MASSRIPIPESNYFDDDDDSDEENDVSRITSVITGNDLPPMSIDALLEELAGYSRTVNNREAHNLRALRRSRKTCASKAVQTSTDVSGIPQAWILQGEYMVNNLYTGLNDIINTLYHQNYGTHIQYSMQYQSASNNMNKDIPCQFGRGQPRFPSMRLPLAKLDYHKLIVNSEEFKRKLRNLKDTAEKLSSLIPYLDINVNYDVERSKEETSKVMKNQYQQTESTEPNRSLMNTDESFMNVGRSRGRPFERIRNPTVGYSQPKHKSAGDKNKSKSCESLFNQQISLCKHELQRNVDESIKVNFANDSGDRYNSNRKKDERIIKENPLKTKSADSTSNNKNFIQKNIMALKAQPGAACSGKSSSAACSSKSSSAASSYITGCEASSSKTLCAASHDTGRNLPAQKRREKKN